MEQRLYLWEPLYENRMSFKNRNVISMKDFSRKEIDHVLDTAEKLEPVARGEERSRLLDGKIIALLFLNQAQGQGCLLNLPRRDLEGRFSTWVLWKQVR